MTPLFSFLCAQTACLSIECGRAGCTGGEWGPFEDLNFRKEIFVLKGSSYGDLEVFELFSEVFD